MDETIPALFRRQVQAHRTRPLFWVKREGAYRPITWAVVFSQVECFATYLIECGVRPGDRVLLFSENRPEWGVADLAIQSVGAWTVPLYPNLSAGDLALIGQDAQPVLAIGSTPEHVQALSMLQRQVPSLRTLVALCSPPGAGHAWAKVLDQGLHRAPALGKELAARRGGLKASDTATLIYTSGTTGQPKGVMLSHDNFLSNVRACAPVMPVTSEDLHLSFLPLCHVFERMAGWYYMMAAGAQIAFAESMDTIPENMREVRPTVMLGVPRFFEKLYGRVQEGLRQMPPAKRRLAEWAIRVGQARSAALLGARSVPPGMAAKYWLADRLVFRKLRGRLGGRLRFFISGSAPLAKEIGEFFHAVGVAILEGYGLTETSPVIAVNRLAAPRFGTVGPPIPGVDVRIAEDGEILTRGPHVMQGYYRKPEETVAVLKDGWFSTGDIGHLDETGRLVITDRKKDLIKTAGGKFVAPQKLENLFVTDPYISQAFVFGDKQRYCVALIVPNFERLRQYAQEQEIPAPSMPALVADPRIQRFYRERVQARQQDLASFEQVKQVAVLDQEFSLAAGELTPTLKAKRATIAQRHAATLQRLYDMPSPAA